MGGREEKKRKRSKSERASADRSAAILTGETRRQQQTAESTQVGEGQARGGGGLQGHRGSAEGAGELHLIGSKDVVRKSKARHWISLLKIYAWKFKMNRRLDDQLKLIVD